MPRLLDTADRADAIAAAVGRIIASRGTTALTVRAIGAECGISPAAILQHLSGKDRVLHVSADRWVTAWAHSRRTRAHMEGTGALLPATDDDVHEARVWLGLVEIGRNHAGVGNVLSRDAEVERDLLDRVTDGQLDDDALHTLVSMVHGLRLAICDPVTPMPVGRAAVLFERQASAFLTSAS